MVSLERLEEITRMLGGVEITDKTRAAARVHRAALINGNERLTLTFDCRACEMHVMGRIKNNILEAKVS